MKKKILAIMLSLTMVMDFAISESVRAYSPIQPVVFTSASHVQSAFASE